MPSELELRLDALFREAPEPDPGAGEEALQRALQALRPEAASRRGLRAAVLALATVVVLLVIAAGSLAAAGALHVSFGAKAKPRPVTTQLVLPKGVNGAVAVVDGRLSVVTKGGFRLQGLPVSTAALSPHARYVATGVADSLVAMAPDGHRAWSHPAGGTVVAIAWAPDGLRIAYVVHAGHRFALHVIYGNGIHDTTIDRSVRAVRPSWRADSLALAYVGAGGSPVLYDLAHESRHLVAVDPPAIGLAFAPTGHALAVEQVGGVSLLPRGRSAIDVADGNVEAFGWLGGRLAVAVPGLDSAVIRLFAPDGTSRGSFPASGIVRAVTSRLVVVQREGTLLAGRTMLLDFPPGTTVRDLQLG